MLLMLLLTLHVNHCNLGQLRFVNVTHIFNLSLHFQQPYGRAVA